MCHSPVFAGNQVLRLAWVSSFPEMAAVKNKPVSLFSFPCTFLLFLLLKRTYPVSWTERIPALSWPSPGCSWSGPIQTPGKRQGRKWFYTGGGRLKNKAQLIALSPLVSGGIKEGLASSSSNNNNLSLTYFWHRFHFSPHISNFFILASALGLPRLTPWPTNQTKALKQQDSVGYPQGLRQMYLLKLKEKYTFQHYKT